MGVDGVYKEKYPKRTLIRIVDQSSLEEFRRTWRYHHPLASEQLAYAGSASRVESVGFYHGGDVLYSLKGIPGIWHESCLTQDPGH
jgi:diadenosine tetraphosphatase ApaH/serine/threonine PP2A family protein phosphatase